MAKKVCKEYKPITDKRKVLEVAEKLASKGILSKRTRLHGLISKGVLYHYNDFHQLKFYIEHDERWRNEDMAVLVAEKFNEYGFSAEYKHNWGCVWVDIDPFQVQMEKLIDECFKELGYE